jgi:hypothetical protein
MVHEILANLSLIGLARISRTCRSFNAVYRRLLAKEQKARHNLANSSCGRERVMGMIWFTTHLLKEEVAEAQFFRKSWGSAWRVCADGTLHGPIRPTSVRQSPREPGDILVWPYLIPGPPAIGSVYVEAGNCRFGQFFMKFGCNGKGVTIFVTPASDDDLVFVAIVHAMLSKGLASFVYEAGSRVEIRIRGPINPTNRGTPAGLKAQIAPLLPFASRYTPVEEMPWKGNPFEERMQIRQGECSAE